MSSDAKSDGHRVRAHGELDRRRFLAQTGGAAAALACAAPTLVAAPARDPLGIQFFTFNALASRGWPEFAAAMERAHQIGYEGIQLAGLMGHEPDRIRQHAVKLGLSLRSMHMGNDQVRAFRAREGSIADAQDAVYTPTGIVQVARVNLPLARDLGCEWGMIAASGPANMRSIDNVLRLCEALNSANEIARRIGLKLSYHAHAPEFTQVEGQVPFDVMLVHTDPSIRYELDVCWAAAGGADPVDLINRHHERLVSFHLKDLSRDRKAATAGDGTLNFAAIRAASRKVEGALYYVECDIAAGTNPDTEATRARRYLQSLGWGNTG